MGFVPSPLSQRLLDLALEIMPNVVTDTITRTPKTNRLPSWDPFECGPEDMAAIRDALKDMAKYVQDIKTWPGTGIALANALAGLTENTISIGCKDCKAPTYTHNSGTLPPSRRGLKYFMKICETATNPNQRISNIMANVFVELIALAGGNAVDQIGLFEYLIEKPKVPPGSIPGPGPGALCIMKAEGKPLPPPFPAGYYAGKYMVWDGLHGGYYTGNQVDPTSIRFALFSGSIGGLPNWQIPMNMCP